jgi:hypothetical protein
MMSLPSAPGLLFSIFKVSLQTMQTRRSISGLLSSFNAFSRSDFSDSLARCLLASAATSSGANRDMEGRPLAKQATAKTNQPAPSRK